MDKTKTIASTALFLALMAIGWAYSPTAAAKTLHVPMYQPKNFFRESCFEIKSGQELTYDVSTPFPVRFDIHHHTDTGTVVIDRGRIASEYIHSVVVEFGGVYCFTVTNPKERPNAFEVVIEYKVTGA